MPNPHHDRKGPKTPRPKAQMLLEEIRRRKGMTTVECQRYVWELTHPDLDFSAPGKVWTGSEYVDWQPGMLQRGGLLPERKPPRISHGFWSTHLWGSRSILPIWCDKGEDGKWRLKPGKRIKAPFYYDAEKEAQYRQQQIQAASQPDFWDKL